MTWKILEHDREDFLQLVAVFTRLGNYQVQGAFEKFFMYVNAIFCWGLDQNQTHFV